MQRNSAELPHIITPVRGQLAASDGLDSYANYLYIPPHKYRPVQQFEHQQYQQQVEQYQQSFQPYQQSFHPRPLHDQPQQIKPQPFPMQPQQFVYPAHQLMVGQLQTLQQRPNLPINYHNQQMSLPQQIDGRHSSFLTQSFPAQRVTSQPPHSPTRGRVFQHVRPQLQLDHAPLYNGLPDGTKPLDDISSAACRLRVETMQRMLEAPCFGCLQNLSAEEASTHPQIYCVHLPSAIRRTVLSDHEQWKQMCAARQDGDNYFDHDVSKRAGNSSIIKLEKTDEKRLRLGSGSTQNTPTDSFLPPAQPLRLSGSQAAASAVESEQDNDARGPFVHEPQDHLSTPTDSTKVVVDSFGEPESTARLAPEDFNTTVSTVPEAWAVESIRELLELKNAAEPGTPLEVAIALQQQLRNGLLVDVTEGDPQDGEPSAIGLLQVLDQRVESLQAEPADG